MWSLPINFLMKSLSFESISAASVDKLQFFIFGNISINFIDVQKSFIINESRGGVNGVKRLKFINSSFSIKSIFDLIVASTSSKLYFNELESILNVISFISFILDILQSISDIFWSSANNSILAFSWISAIFLLS